ncbi:Aldo/keto reductase [Hypoxylon trugodes]|uniref:Aldo/keto reductase n=1 Tax=Hypoxylon trugodes TaxID=326681 RepID=UPI00219744D3|nr:Aldo/keto reductase [Hypoxylon trugodes]KAI1388762.1 Aldo/keto reductase [Hypoxylon trugodes]
MPATAHILRPFYSKVSSFAPIQPVHVNCCRPFPNSGHSRYILFPSNRQILSFRSYTMDAKPAPMPKLIYGTAWKKDATADLVFLALKSGFRGIDTAAQPRHYKEHLVGAGIKLAISSGIIKRNDLYLQTKFTSIGGQDPNDLPYDPSAPLEEQVHSSIASSLENFRYSGSEDPYIDSLVLHSPLRTLPDTIQIWKTLETYVPHKIRQLGISNTPLQVLDYLCKSPDIGVRPACVQNRFYPATGWEVDLRAYCRGAGIVFQSFWTLSGNPQLLGSMPVRKLATSANVELPVALYALVLGLEGTVVLDGTTNEAHMKGDLEGIGIVNRYAESGGQPIWSDCLNEFKGIIGENE